jgi:hypothetical protein
MNPEQAWQSALGQLQRELPKEYFDTWVRDAHLVSCIDGMVTIGVRNNYTRDRLESRLSGTVTHLMTGILDQHLEVSFVVDQPENVDDHQAELSTTVVRVVQRLTYEEVVKPGRVVSLPGYFSRLIPEIGARNAWLYVGWRQSVWDGHRQDSSPRTRRIPVRQISRYSALSRRTFFRAAEKPSTWEALAGLVERNDARPHWQKGTDHHPHRLPGWYTVHTTLPLSCQDAIAVRDRLALRIQAGISLLNALEDAIKLPDLVDEWQPPATHLQIIPAIPRTVLDIACELGGMEENLPSDLQAAAEGLHQRIISSFGTILLTHYFLETVIPRSNLTASQAWLVALLRDRCYINSKTGEMRDQVLVRGGYAELAAWLGLSRSKTVWEWFRDEAGPVTAFVSVLPPDENDEPEALRLCVRQDEPIFDGALDDQGVAEMAPANGADGTQAMAEMAPSKGAHGTAGWREWRSLKHLSTDINTQGRNAPSTQIQSADVPSSWLLRKLLIQSHLHSKAIKELLAKNASVLAFISWLLFAFSRSGRKIKNPLTFTLASLNEDPSQGPGGVYDQLAALPPSELVRLVRWSVRTASTRYGLQKESSGNDLWETKMGASNRHKVLLAILLGEDPPAK